MKPSSGITLLALLAVPVSGHAQVNFDFEQRVFCEPGAYVKDHTLLELDGEYHLIYIVGNLGESWTQPGNEVDFGHASSSDLVHWTVHDRILSIDPATWKNRNLWAPHVVRDGDTYIMAYTGVDSSVAQQIGIATSADLFGWVDFSVAEAAYRPDTTWALWQPGTWSNCRDAYIRKLPSSQWMMVTTAQTRVEFAGAELGALSLAFSDDGFTWTDDGLPLAVNNGGRLLESPFIYTHGGMHYLLFNESSVTGVQVTTSTDLFSGWDVTQTDFVDPFGFAPEVLETQEVTLFSRIRPAYYPEGVVGRLAVVDTLRVVADQLELGEPNRLWDAWTRYFIGGAFLLQPTFGDVPSGRTGVSSNVEGHYWIATAETNPAGIGISCDGCPPEELRQGIIRSRVFAISGVAMQLRVGGTADPDLTYVALRRADDETALFSETGTGTDVMSLRQWDLAGLEGTEVFLEIADLSPTGHINVDAIRELTTTTAVPAAAAPSAAVSRLRAAPNPARQPTAHYELDQAADVKLAIYDVQGRQVRLLVDAPQSAGRHLHPWDGLSSDGREAPPGVYFMRLEAGGLVHTARIVRIH